MKEPYDSILDSQTQRLHDLNFELIESSSHNRIYESNDLRLDFYLDQHEIPSLDPFIALKKDGVEYRLHWLQRFLDNASYKDFTSQLEKIDNEQNWKALSQLERATNNGVFLYASTEVSNFINYVERLIKEDTLYDTATPELYSQGKFEWFGRLP